MILMACIKLHLTAYFQLNCCVYFCGNQVLFFWTGFRAEEFNASKSVFGRSQKIRDCGMPMWNILANPPTRPRASLAELLPECCLYNVIQYHLHFTSGQVFIVFLCFFKSSFFVERIILSPRLSPRSKAPKTVHVVESFHHVRRSQLTFPYCER